MKKKLVLPCLRGVIGDWVYYSSLMNGNQISEWIETAKEIREAKYLDDYLQRTLKDRKESVAEYLLKDDSRFFNSIIVGVFEGMPDWVDFDFPKLNDVVSSQNEAKEIRESIGLMIFNGEERMFAIDGQHRVEGIKIAYQNSNLNVLVDDQFSVLFVAHMDDAKGKKRTRKLFSDINKKAVPVAKGDKIIIDEEDICSIVTRRIYAEYPFFQNGKLISLTENANLEVNDTEHFTNLLAIHSVCKALKSHYKKIPKSKEWDEHNVIALKTIVWDFFDFAINNITEYQNYFIHRVLTLEAARKSNQYLLFRPIGLTLIAKLYSFFKKKNKLKDLEDNLNKIGFIMPRSPLNYILWNNGKMEANSKNQVLAFDLCLYLLNSLSEEEGLLNRFRDIRKNPEINLPEKLL